MSSNRPNPTTPQSGAAAPQDSKQRSQKAQKGQKQPPQQSDR